MNSVWGYTLLSVLVVSMISLVGIFSISVNQKLLKRLLLYLVSFSAGALFGDAFIHLLPEVINETGFSIRISLSILLGILVFFILEKFIHWHHYHDPSSKKHVHPFAITNLIGDSLHNLIDGLIIGVSYLVSIPVGIATTIAVVIHEIPQEIGDFGVLLQGGFTKAKALFFNFLTALMAVIGAVAALLMGASIEGMTTFLVPFAAGGFIYVAGADLIPELHKEIEIRKSFFQLIFFLLGIAIMVALLLKE